MSKVVIIGGGIIGLCSAYYLRKAGHTVTVIDQSDFTSGCSYGNAGMVVPSHFIPLAAPGMVAKGIRWMFNSSSPFYIKPRWDAGLFRWGYKFYKSSTTDYVNRSMPALKALSLYSKASYQELVKELPFDFGWNEKGLLMLYQTETAELEEREVAGVANRIGIEAHVLDGHEVQQLEPDVEVRARGGIYFPGDSHLTPQLFMRGLLQHIKDLGVEIIQKTIVTDFEIEQGEVRHAITSTGDYVADEWLIAAGSWSSLLSQKLKLSLLMQGGKGYSFTLPEVQMNVRIPTIFVEARVAVTPMGNSLRFGGTMEIGGINSSIDMRRVMGIVQSIPAYYPGLKIGVPDRDKVWHGLRPCSPDGLPYIGRMEGLANVTVATGHAMMGVSLAPATGKIVAALVNQETPEIAIHSFKPERFG